MSAIRLKHRSFTVLILPLLMVISLFFFASHEGTSAASPASYTVSGRVIDYTGKGIADILIKFSNGTSVKTAKDGTWKKSGFSRQITITPSDERWVFVPKSRTVKTGKSFLLFKGYPKPYKASGRVTDYSGKGLAGVKISFSNTQSSTVTNDSGEWSYDGLKGAPLVTPSKPGYIFIPSTRTASRTAGQITFTGTPKVYKLSGRVTDSSGNGIEGAALNFDGGFGTVYTDRDGRWSIDSISGNVTIIAVKPGWSFEPNGWKATHASDAVNFLATPLTESIKSSSKEDINPEQWPNVRLTPKNVSEPYLSSQAKDTRLQTIFTFPDIDTRLKALEPVRDASETGRADTISGAVSLTIPKQTKITLPIPGTLLVEPLRYEAQRSVSVCPNLVYKPAASITAGIDIEYGASTVRSLIGVEQSDLHDTWLSAGASITAVKMQYLNLAGTLGIFLNTSSAAYGPFGELHFDIGSDTVKAFRYIQLSAGYRRSIGGAADTGPYFKIGLKDLFSK